MLQNVLSKSFKEGMASFSLATGLREANLTQLKWNQVDLCTGHALIHADELKTSRAIPVPLNETALSIVRA